MLAELGVVGLALLLVALTAPLVAALKVRRRALIPAAFGAYVAFLAHAAGDWDWEMPAVTLAALFCACGLLLAARGRDIEPIATRLRVGLLTAVVPLIAFALAGAIGYQALEASKKAEDNREFARAESEARKAARWLPWSAEPWEALAGVHFDQNDFPGARTALLEALERDRGDWAIWYDFGVASEGRERQRAYEEAARLNPRSRNVAVLRTLGILPPLPESTTKDGSSGEPK
jgi:cytochrome c-type biogenesis protein CcmH/NrfG